MAFADYIKASEIYANISDSSLFAAAIGVYAIAKNLAPDSWKDEAYFLLGKLMVRAGQYRLNENPERLIREGVKELAGILPSNSDWYLLWKIASAYKKLREFENASKYYSMALAKAEKQSAKSTEVRLLYKVQFDFLSTADRLAHLKKGSEVRIKGKVEKQVSLDSNQMRIDLDKCEVLEE